MQTIVLSQARKALYPDTQKLFITRKYYNRTIYNIYD